MPYSDLLVMTVAGAPSKTASLTSDGVGLSTLMLPDNACEFEIQRTHNSS